MPIKIVAETAAPARLHVRGTVSSKQDYADVLTALRDMKTGQAIVVAMDAAAWAEVKKPEVTFANNLRRMFDAKGLSITAYQSNKMEITIRKATALDNTKRGPHKK